MTSDREEPPRRFEFSERPLHPPVTETERWLYGLTRFGMKPGLSNIRTLAERFGHPERSLRFMHVAGTNGKGSVCHFLDALLRAAGWRTGLFTSPHLLHVTERMRVAGAAIPEARLAELLALVEAPVRELEATFFETMTLVALLHFKAEAVDWVVWETGLGGRLDSTRVVTPEACLLSSLSRDHTRYLGQTLEEIALEKLGIGVAGRPYFCALDEGPLMDLARREADRQGFELRELNRLLPWKLEGDELVLEPFFSWVPPGGFVYSDRDCATLEGVARELPGRYRLPGLPEVQARNAALALLCLAEMGLRRGERLLPPDPGVALAATQLPARFHILRREPLLVLDGAHNPAALHRSIEAFRRRLPRGVWGDDDRAGEDGAAEGVEAMDVAAGAEPLIIFGCMEDKEVEEMLKLLADCPLQVLFTAARQPRALPPDFFVGHTLAQDREWEACADLAAAFERAGSSRPILVTGSFYLAAEAYWHQGVDPYAPPATV